MAAFGVPPELLGGKDDEPDEVPDSDAAGGFWTGGVGGVGGIAAGGGVTGRCKPGGTDGRPAFGKFPMSSIFIRAASRFSR
jgi:hypothetical protein